MMLRVTLLPLLLSLRVAVADLPSAAIWILVITPTILTSSAEATGDIAMAEPATEQIFANVYSDPHPVIEAQRAWLAAYEATFFEDDTP